ncbi:uncharacterized protein LAJ45_06341 [Morchella importuna]|uniref:Large ribosomal subunit protein mL54 n=1 Tax=Morchella conica CCBAS932 TaxID=1392247 RepID=A0A3N4LA52_9PEZI|nr:uncharacterized protein LAJ45_06341 [Morchella importuna]KAH8149710.1 hypothetical protein LAJ45_06341 [Morchella importuna]RPB17521.1 hypothetical protein P167DRAFT_514716 [Morchella conica CCBAS932]
MFCLRRIQPAVSLRAVRTYSVANPNVVNQAKPLQSSTPGGEGSPSATSTSAAQPFSIPLTPAAPKIAVKPKITVVSGTMAGTPLKNINYLKGKSDPVALEDSEYPEWLWSLLDKKTTVDGLEGEEVGDLYSKSKKERKIAKKRAEKVAALQSLNSEIRIPITEQTIDLPFTTSPNHPFTRVVAAVGGVGENIPGAKPGLSKAMRPSTVEIGGEVQVSAEEALAARLEVKREMRKKSRAAIKEKNFLSTLGR